MWSYLPSSALSLKFSSVAAGAGLTFIWPDVRMRVGSTVTDGCSREAPIRSTTVSSLHDDSKDKPDTHISNIVKRKIAFFMSVITVQPVKIGKILDIESGNSTFVIQNRNYV